jgi:hypothetical protein
MPDSDPSFFRSRYYDEDRVRLWEVKKGIVAECGLIGWEFPAEDRSWAVTECALGGLNYAGIWVQTELLLWDTGK